MYAGILKRAIEYFNNQRLLPTEKNKHKHKGFYLKKIFKYKNFRFYSTLTIKHYDLYTYQIYIYNVEL